jgi:hypothetical protein
MSSIENLGALNFISPSDSTPATRFQPAAPVEDQVQFATIPLTAQVEQLETKTPSSFHAVLDDAIRELRAAASQSTNAIETAYLSGLADRFQQLEESGAGAPHNPAQNLSPDSAP